MTGRGIDQILRHPGDPTLYETWAKSAVDYLRLAERRSGPIPRRVAPSYIWGEALEVLDEAGVDARMVNLETAVTDIGEPWPDKGIHYRMHPDNVECLTAAGIDCCSLANNHVLDWSRAGLERTLATLDLAGISHVGAGRDDRAAAEPAVIEAGDGRVVVVALGTASSGIPPDWRAGRGRPGVAMATSLRSQTAEEVAEVVTATAHQGDVVVVSIHWGPNWGHDIPSRHRRFAHDLIDTGGVHVIHGHSSHHPLAIEVYRGKPILYGCGDLINDYEGIAGHEQYMPGLGALYLMSLDAVTGDLQRLELVPMRLHRFRLVRADRDDANRLRETLNRAGRSFGAHLVTGKDGELSLRW